jgi:cytochrome b561
MVSTIAPQYLALVATHKTLGIAILILAVIRIIVRLRSGTPPLPADLPAWQRLAALASHVLLYALMLALPLLGWAMLSAGGYPVMLGDALRLPAILPENAALFAWLREAHRYLAWLLFLTFVAHMSAGLYHGLIRRDGVLAAMAPGRRRRVQATARS